MWHRIRSTVLALLHGGRHRRELDEEMSFHVDLLTEDLMRAGLSPEQARREARRRFGVPERVHEGARRARGAATVDEVVRNLRFAVRGMRRSPLLAATFVLTLALCIGFGTAVFSAVDAALWTSLPYPDSDRLALASLYDAERGPGQGQVAVDGRTWFTIRDNASDFQSAAYSGWVRGVNAFIEGSPRFVQQQRVGSGFFSTLGVEPLIGRGFSPAEDAAGGPPVVVLSHALWTGALDADPDVLGGTIRLKGELHAVVGVMPPDFRSDANADLWTPLQAATSGEGAGTNYTALVRIPNRMSWSEARARFRALEAPPGRAGQPVFGLTSLEDARSAGVRLPLLVLLFAVGLMILVGFANMAGIQVSRAMARQTEIATRRALGSGVSALVRQLLMENLVLGALGGVAGLGVASLCTGGLETLLRANLGADAAISLGPRAMVAAVALTLSGTLLFGLAPLVQVGRRDALRVLISGARGVAGGTGRTLRRLLLVGEVAVVTVLLFAAVLLARSYGHLTRLDPGFSADDVLTVQFSLDDARYRDADAVNRLFRETLDELRDVPGVSSAAVALSLPYERPLNMPFRLDRDEEGQQPRLTNLVYVTPGFFETLEIPLRDGRVLTEADGRDAPAVAVANQALMDAHFEGRASLGARVLLGMGHVELVGVVGNVQQGGGGWGSSQPVWAAPTLYVAADQMTGPVFRQVHVWFSPSWVIRSAPGTAGRAGPVARVFEDRDSRLPVARTASLDDVMARAFARDRFQALFLLVVTGFALLLAGIGLYGIVAQEVVERRREMGVRLALGATPGRAILITGMAGMRLAGWGLGIGCLAALATGRLLTSMLWGVSPLDPVALGTLVSCIAALATVASFVPALRMGRIDPARVLTES